MTSTSSRHKIWVVSVSFVLFQFFLQLSAGAIIGNIMIELHLSALHAGLLSSAFYVIYVSLQIPVGLFFDRYDSRLLLAINALLCALGCLIFTYSYSLIGLFLGRMVIGTGSAFAFIGLSHLLRQYYPATKFAFMIGLSETLGFLVTVVSMIALSALIDSYGWRSCMKFATLAGLCVSYLCWTCIPSHVPPTQNTLRFSVQLLQVINNRKAWINGLCVGLIFGLITAFGALWAIPFIVQKLECSTPLASVVSAMFFLGTALSCPLFGYLSTLSLNRRTLMQASCLSTNALLLLLLYLPIHQAALCAILMFMIGLCCGAYMLCYSIANEISPPNLLSTSTGFTNMLAMLTTPLLQSWIGYQLDNFHHEINHYNLANYQHALLVIPISLLGASILIYFLPEKTKNKDSKLSITITQKS